MGIRTPSGHSQGTIALVIARIGIVLVSAAAALAANVPVAIAATAAVTCGMWGIVAAPAVALTAVALVAVGSPDADTWLAVTGAALQLHVYDCCTTKRKVP